MKLSIFGEVSWRLHFSSFGLSRQFLRNWPRKRSSNQQSNDPKIDSFMSKFTVTHGIKWPPKPFFTLVLMRETPLARKHKLAASAQKSHILADSACSGIRFQSAPEVVGQVASSENEQTANRNHCHLSNTLPKSNS